MEPVVSWQHVKAYTLFPSPSDGEKIIANMPKRFRKGSVLMDEGDLMLYFTVFWTSFTIFLILFQLLKLFFDCTNIKYLVYIVKISTFKLTHYSPQPQDDSFFFS